MSGFFGAGRVLVAVVLLALAACPGLAAEQAVAEQAAPAEAVYDMEAAVLRGLEANPTIVQARADLLGSDYGRKSALSDMFPSATAGYGWTHQDRRPVAGAGDQDEWALHLNLHQPIFTGFNLLSSYQKARLTKEQNEAKLLDAELALVKEIQSKFLALLKARMDVKSAQDAVERLKSQLKVTSAFYDVGLKPRLDVLQAEVELATAEQDLLKAENDVSTCQAKLNTLLNLPLEAEVTYTGKLTSPPFDRDLKQCLDTAYVGRPDIQIGKKSVDIAEKDLGITASAFYPELAADLDYYKYGGDPDVNGGRNYNAASAESWTAGLSLDWTFFQSGSTYFSYKESRENLNKVRAQLDETRLNAGYEIKESLLNLKEAADRIGVARKSVDAARESYRMAQARYQAQVGTNTDVLDAQSRVSSSEAQLIEALADYETALSSLYVSMGVKNPDLGAK
ncbi:MAG: TolC family protein [Desulfovibrionaceae bacterium]|nr:TolC family protein [Desulfovibrionaceae bacterium]